MGVIFDVWDLHRERILQIGGILLCVLAAALVVADGIGQDRDSYETGSLLGTVTRNFIVPVLLATLSVYAVRRFYWYEEEASWKQVTPEAWAIAGVLSVVLAVALGAPQTRVENAQEATLAAIDDCAQETAAVTANLPPSAVELSSAQTLKVNPQLAAAPSVLRDATRMYVWRTDGAPFVLSTFPIPADRVGDSSVLGEYFEGIGETMPPGLSDRAGITNRPIAGRPAYEIIVRGGGTRFVAVLDGCHVVTLEARSAEADTAVGELLARAPS